MLNKKFNAIKSDIKELQIKMDKILEKLSQK
jgi:hypothetical protein